MKQRSTFFHKQENAIDPEALVVSSDSITGPEIHAVREDRLTLSLEELPDELSELLQTSRDLHIRWVSSEFHDNITPLVSRLPPGLHVFYTPLGDDGVEPCGTLQSLFGDIECVSLTESFVELPRDRFAHSTAYQYFSPLSSLSQFTNVASGALCTSQGDSTCLLEAQRLNNARSLDVSYDEMSKTIKAAAVSPHQSQPLSVSTLSSHRTEVGILTTDSPPNLKPYDQGIVGLLTVLGESKEASTTLFAFHSRHRQVEGGAFSSVFLEPTGLHPTLQLRGLGSTRPPQATSVATGEKQDECGLYAYFTLPRFIFADKYQLADPLFLASKNLSALSFISQPVDLEAPEYVMDVWGSSLLLQLVPPPPADTKEEMAESWTAEVPLHLRYLAPAEGGYTNISVPFPAVFWACSTSEDVAFGQSPFERTKLGYDGLFEQNTVFWHVDPIPETGSKLLLNHVAVPVADLEQSGWTSSVTAFVLFLGFGWIVGKLIVGALDKKATRPSNKVKQKEKKSQ